MMKHIATSIRLACIALVFAVIGTCQLSAQVGVIKECECKHITIHSDKNVGCKVNVVVIYPNRPSPLVTIAPGETIEVPCEDGAEITVVDCHFHKNPLGPDGCLHGFPAESGCCIEACLTKDEKGCPLLEIKPAFVKCKC